MSKAERYNVLMGKCRWAVDALKYNTGREVVHAKAYLFGSRRDPLAHVEETPIASAHRKEACDV